VTWSGKNNWKKEGRVFSKRGDEVDIGVLGRLENFYLLLDGNGKKKTKKNTEEEENRRERKGRRHQQEKYQLTLQGKSKKGKKTPRNA